MIVKKLAHTELVDVCILDRVTPTVKLHIKLMLGVCVPSGTNHPLVRESQVHSFHFTPPGAPPCHLPKACSELSHPKLPVLRLEK